jgi:hypothetical protein
MRAHATAMRDVGFLPEGEMHARAQGTTPYDLARDEAKYPFARLYAAADLATLLDPAAIPQLRTLAGCRQRRALLGRPGFPDARLRRGEAGEAALRRAFADSSPFVRIVAAEALAAHGAASDLSWPSPCLRELAPPDKNGAIAAMAALSAIEALGPKAASLHPLVRALKINTGSPHNRFDSYIPRLITNITGADPEASATKAKGKGKKKAATP